MGIREELAERSKRLRERDGAIERHNNKPLEQIHIPVGKATKTRPNAQHGLELPTSLADPKVAFRESQKRIAAPNNTTAVDGFTGESLKTGAARSASVAPVENITAQTVESSTGEPANSSPLKTGALAAGSQFVQSGSGNLPTSVTLTNEDAPKFRGGVMDSKAFREQANQFYADQDRHRMRNTLNTLRQRVQRGGFGSSKAADQLVAIMNAQAAQTEASGKGGLTAKDQIALARFGLEQKQFDSDQRRAGEDSTMRYFENAYKDEPQEFQRRFQLAAGLQESIPNIQGAAEADRVITLMDRFTDDTGFIGGRSPIEAFSQIASIERSKNGKDLVLTDIDGKVYDNAGPEWFGTKDLSTRDQEELLNLWEKKR